MNKKYNTPDIDFKEIYLTNRDLPTSDRKANYKPIHKQWPAILLWFADSQLYTIKTDEEIKIKEDNFPFFDEKDYVNKRKVSPSNTLAHLEENKKWAVRLIAEETSRGSLYHGSATDNSRYCALVPLFMSAHKQYNKINYERWDKTDPKLKYIMGIKLYDDLSPWFKTVGLLAKASRKDSLTTPAGVEKSKTVWLNHNLKYGPNKGDVLRATNLMRYIHFQQWLANVELRHEYMILDSINWDNIPESLDGTLQVENTKRKVIDTSDELPF